MPQTRATAPDPYGNVQARAVYEGMGEGGALRIIKTENNRARETAGQAYQAVR